MIFCIGLLLGTIPGEIQEREKIRKEFCKQHCDSIQMNDYEIREEKCWCNAGETKHLVETIWDEKIANQGKN